ANLIATGTTKFGGITYTWPGTQSANTYLKTDGSGGLSWAAISASSESDWQYGTNYALDMVTTSSTIPVWIKDDLYASSTVRINTAGGKDALYVGSSTAQFVIDDHGRVGIASSSPYAKLGISGNGVVPSFMVGDEANNTDFMVTGAGLVAIGSSSPYLTTDVKLLVDGYITAPGAGYRTERFGYGAGGITSTSSESVFVGYEAGRITYGNSNTFVGYHAGYNNTGGYSNVAFGGGSLAANTTGYYNTAIGTGGSLAANTTGFSNVSVGYYSLGSNTAGYSNIAIGGSSLSTNITGYENVSMGIGSAQNNRSATSTVFIGFQAGYGVSGQTANRNNVVIGQRSGYGLTSGSYNTLLGYQSGYNLSDGASNVFLGYMAGYGEDQSNKLHIANNSNSTLIYGDFSNETVTIGATSSLAQLQINTKAATDAFYVGSSTAQFVIDDHGRVGIGTSTITSGTRMLIDGEDISTTGLSISSLNDGAASIGIDLSTAQLDSWDDKYIYINSANQWGNNTLMTYQISSAGSLDFSADSSGALEFNVGGVERMRINNSGYLGLSTTTPSSLLSVHGNALISGDLHTANLIATGTTRFGGITYTWPGTQSANTYLKTDGSGGLSWAAVSSSESDWQYGT
ncbi:MAG: hypothetical protein AB1599_10790, partial [Planctomycetota bacterium]